MNDKQKHWTVVTTNGTHWAARGDSEQDVRDNFFVGRLGIEIAEVLPVRLFTHEEEQELRREKHELSHHRFKTDPFDEFDKSCKAAIKACNDFIDMKI